MLLTLFVRLYIALRYVFCFQLFFCFLPLRFRYYLYAGHANDWVELKTVWNCMGPHGTVWNRMEQYMTKWGRMEPHGTIYTLFMGSNKNKWDRMGLMESHGIFIWDRPRLCDCNGPRGTYRIKRDEV